MSSLLALCTAGGQRGATQHRAVPGSSTYQKGTTVTNITELRTMQNRVQSEIREAIRTADLHTGVGSWLSKDMQFDVVGMPDNQSHLILEVRFPCETTTDYVRLKAISHQNAYFFSAHTWRVQVADDVLLHQDWSTFLTEISPADLVSTAAKTIASFFADCEL